MAGVYVTLLALCCTVVFRDSMAFIAQSSQSPLKVASFNIQHFGRGKMADPVVSKQIAQIVERYDVISIMETRDSTNTALPDLWALLNQTDSWGLVYSNPLGRSTYKEQYVFYYRTEKARLMGSYQISDPQDVYEREPFAAEFQYWSVATGSKRRVALMSLHSKPLDTPAELRQLPGDIKDTARHFSSAGGVIAMGDFNADCRYVSATKQGTLDIFDPNSPDFTSLIAADSDTTTKQESDCAYDRIISYGSDVRAQEAKVYNYQTAMKLDDTQALAVSDHFPVEFKLF